ncbi:hypothetical protein RB195_023043 [Necator americanus]|uniref:39S ribosomal protein L41, mitochondrial n=1 Tax=Necator americanus TaxID=51031 RepID=A0ABR1EK51_NECAM
MEQLRLGGHSRLLLRSLRHLRPLASSPFDGRWTYHSRGLPFRSPTYCYVGKKSYFTRQKPEHLKKFGRNTDQGLYGEGTKLLEKMPEPPRFVKTGI